MGRWVWKIGFLLAVGIGSAWADTVSSLDQIPKHLKTPEAKAFWKQQMEGKPAPDGLGVHLPPSLSAKIISDLLVPHDDHEARNLIGAKPWLGRPDSYVAIVCTGGAGPFKPDEPRCAQSDNGGDLPPWHVYLG